MPGFVSKASAGERMSTKASDQVLVDLGTPIHLPEQPQVVAVGDSRSPRDGISGAPKDGCDAPDLERRHRLVLRAADVATATASPVIGAGALALSDPARAGDMLSWHKVVAAVAIVVSLHLHGLYRRPAARLRPSGWWRPTVLARCLPTAALLALGTGALVPDADRMTLTAAVAMTLPAALLIPVGRRVLVRLFGPPTVTRILVVGTGQVAGRLVARLSRCADAVVIGQVDDRRPDDGDATVLGPIRDLSALCAEHRVDRVILAFSDVPDREVLAIVRRLEGRVPVSVVPRMFELLNWRSEIEELHGMPLVHIAPAHLDISARIAKRTLDLVLASVAAVAVLPFCAVAAAAIAWDSPGPVFFRQERTGRNGRTFRIVKFRTMTDDAWERRASVRTSNEVDGPIFKMHHDPRVTRVGRFLRRTSIDELPQLLNVLVGDMSIVGPRPLPVEESNRLEGPALDRFDVSPGITGLWQVSGRSDLSYADLQHLDSVYVRSWSLRWDLRIMMATPRSVLGGRGAY
jgi:exopolysaccharide biosynthesis polyprenyl glycosylphosphotransferase